MTTLRNNNGKDTSWNYWGEVRREETTIHETSKKQEVTKKSREEETGGGRGNHRRRDGKYSKKIHEKESNR